MLATVYAGLLERLGRLLTGSTNPGGCHSHIDVVAGEFVRLGGGTLAGNAVLLALVNSEAGHDGLIKTYS